MRQQKASQRAAYLSEKALQQQHANQPMAMSAMTLSAQPSRVNSSISTPRLTPLRMIERNRGTDKEDINRLENKIKALESDITQAKQVNEERRLDKLENSLINTSLPCLNDNSLLEDALNLSPTKEESGTATKHKELLQKLLSSAGGNNDSLL